MDLSTALDWAAGRSDGVLVTIRRDGRPQTSDITYYLKDGAFLISVTADRAKTVNLRRDPRAVLHITDRPSWSYLSFDGTVELSPVAAAVDDATCDELVEYFEGVTGKPHPDRDEFRSVMVNDRRLVARFAPTSVVGQIN